MKYIDLTLTRIVSYVLGLFFLAFGVSLSIQAGYGVSPVFSLAVAITLSFSITVGITTILANMLFIMIQILLNKRIDVKDFGIQLIIAFLFGFFTDATLYLLQLFPTPDTTLIRSTYLAVSLFFVSLGLLGYLMAKLPLMPYDALTYAISNRFKWKFSKAKITSYLINVCIAGAFPAFILKIKKCLAPDCAMTD